MSCLMCAVVDVSSVVFVCCCLLMLLFMFCYSFIVYIVKISTQHGVLNIALHIELSE